jgi:hypothetical protein
MKPSSKLPPQCFLLALAELFSPIEEKVGKKLRKMIKERHI